MFASRGWMRFALILNLVGTVMLFVSFQATSSNLKIVHTSDGRTALCIDKHALMIDIPPNGLMLGASTCPEWQNARPAAIVNIELPILVTFGFILTTAGFLLQFLSLPSVKTTAQLRKELKEIQRAEQEKHRVNPHTGLHHNQPK